MNPLSRIAKARMGLILDAPFFGSLAMRLAPVVDATLDPPTACTNGIEVRFHPDYVARCTDPQLAGLWCHEVEHPAFGHLWRQGSRCPDRWNIACDFVVNESLDKFIKSHPGCRIALPPGKLYLDPQYDGLSAEEIYTCLGQQPQPPQPDPADPAPGQFTDPPPPAQGEGEGEGEGETPKHRNPETPASDLRQEWQAAAATAATVERTRNQGSMPGGLDRFSDDLTDPVVPWQELLRQFAHVVTRDDYTFTRPNRRYADSGFFLPSLRTEGLGEIIVAIDTSGSIDGPLLREFLSELQGIIDACRPAAVHVISCDARIQTVHTLDAGEPITDVRLKGGGGTRFEPVFEWAASNPGETACLIYFTDLYGSFPDTEPPFPTLWVNYGDPRNSAPFGETANVIQ